MPQTGTVKSVDNISNLKRLVAFHNAQGLIQSKVSGQSRKFVQGATNVAFKNRQPISLAELIKEEKEKEAADAAAAAAAQKAAFDALPEYCTFSTSPITFDDGVPVGGWANVKFHKSGDVEFNGHFHVSGAGPWNVEFGCIVIDGKGRAYTFSKSVSLHGTFSAGSPDGDWSDRTNKPEIAAQYSDIWNNQYFNWQAGCNWDLSALLSDVEDAAKKAGPVIATIVSLFA
jgi:hypothetical protein